MHVVKQLRDGEIHVELLGDDGTPIPTVSPFLRHLRARGCSPNTLLAYAHDLQRFFRFLSSAGIGLGDFTPARALDFLAYLRDLPCRGLTLTGVGFFDCFGLSNYPKTLSSPGFYGGYTPFSDSY